MSYFVYKFVPRRPGFPATMTDTEAATMHEHVAYWQKVADRGTAVVFGPVADPAGSWGVAVVDADTQQDVDAIRAADPVVLADLGPVDVYPMPTAIIRHA